MIQYFKHLRDTKPLLLLLLLGFSFRFLAALFSKGYGWHDDHFLVLEASQSWVDGYDYNRWLPKNSGTPSGHSFFYVGIHYLLFNAMKALGIVSPQLKMFIIRLLHALFSLIILVFGYKIVRKLSDERTAWYAGLLLSLLWFMPFLSVRNLVEFVCITPLMWGMWLLIKEDQEKIKNYLLAGILFGVAFNIRYQSVLFFIGVFLALLLVKKFRPAVVVGLGFALCAILIQGGIDYFVWGKPFAEFTEYVRYNIEYAGSYGGIPWINYVFLILGMLLPPLGFFIAFGFIKSFRKYLLITLPTAVFLLFHFYFQNRQERFILPAVPFIVIAGCMGWQEFKDKSRFWQARTKLLRGCMLFAFVLNSLLIFPITLHYSHRDRVEAMTWLWKQKNLNGFLVEDSNRDASIMFPRFYLGAWDKVERDISRDSNIDELVKNWKDFKGKDRPDFVLFLQEENLEARIEKVKRIYPDLEYQTTIHPSFIDVFLHWMNPRNRNQVCTIYKIR